MDIPKISIIIPIYNSAKTLQYCLDSILIQNTQNLELLLVDDGSTDDSQLICAQYQSDYQNVFYYRKKNGGTYEARNLGLQNASGDYIWFVDSDDMIHPDAIAVFNTIFMSSNTHDLIKFNYKTLLNYDEPDFDKIETENLKYSFFDSVTNLTKFFNSSSCIYLYKNEFLKKNSITFKNNYYEDALFNLQVFDCELSGVALADNLYYYHQNIENSKTSIRDFKTDLIRMESLKELREICNKKKDIEYYFLKTIGYESKLFSIVLYYLKNNIEGKNEIYDACKRLVPKFTLRYGTDDKQKFYKLMYNLKAMKFFIK